MRTIILLLVCLGLSACIATENGFIMRTAEPGFGIQFTFPVPEAPLDDLEILPGETGESEDPEILATPSCESVKGNINSSGKKFYHTVESPQYNQTLIDESKGERFFCTEQEAIDAGWTKAGG